MKKTILTIANCCIMIAALGQANQTLNNLTSPTAVNVNLLPTGNNVQNLGSTSKSWKNIYLDGFVYMDNQLFISNPVSNCTFVGLLAGQSSAAGNNTGFGFQSLKNNVSGFSNTGTGSGSLTNNTSGYANTAMGTAALSFNLDGNTNTAVGVESLLGNLSGYNNTAVGYQALYSNVNTYNNTAVGWTALYDNNSGVYNTAVGDLSGTSCKSNTNCSFFGTSTGQSVITAFNNSTTIGAGGRITASNQVRIGSSSVTSIGGFTGWSNVSDGRFKINVKEDVKGLDFINQLRPITYNLNVMELSQFLGENITGFSPEVREKMMQGINEKSEIVYTGFIAQEVEKAAKNLDFDFSGVDKPQNENSLYGLRYAEFVVPIVKAVQELSKENQELKNEIQTLKNNISELSQKISSTNNQNYSNGFLGQNIPNPFNKNTSIPFVLPSKFTSALIKVINSQTSQTVMEYQLSPNQTSQEVNLNMANGIYSYSLVIDGVTVDTKQMVNLK